MERSRRFYEVLGMRFIGYRPSGQGMDLSDGTVNMTLIVHEGDRPYLEEGEEYIHIGFIVDDARETWQRLREFGATILREDVKARYPVDENRPPVGSFKVADPDGNTIDITDNPEEWRGVR
jgi:catechol 2,3-dioxygenase-like lactoylglutathione lyase family enzyme